jgi:uncharacterized protein involved in outer membrane biogenesis
VKIKFLWLLPAVLLAIGLGTLLALPGFVAAQSHRPAIERFASSLTGREVHIDGKLSLTLLPHPTLTATHITIAGPDHEVISAKALALDIAVAPLLRGQLAVSTLNLDSPVINFPWPLPGGPRAVAPPPWLAALHAHLNNASIALGPLAFSQVSADLFTGPEGAVSISGNGALLGQGVTLSLALGQVGLDGAAPLAVQLNAGPAAAQFSGSLSARSSVSGQISATLPGKIAASGSIGADGTAITLTGLKLTQGSETLSGNASYALAKPMLTADLLGQNLDLDQLAGLPGWAAGLPAEIKLSASNVTVLGQGFPALDVTMSTGPVGTIIHALSLSLPGGGTLSGHAAVAGGGQLSGQLSLTVPDSAALLAAYRLPAMPGWPAARLSASLGGSATQPALQNLTGTLGADHVSGSLVLSSGHLDGQLGFDHLALTPLAAWAGQSPPGAYTADLDVTAAKAELGPVKLSNFALDAALDGTLNVRRVSASLYGGLAAGSFTLDADGRLSAAQGFLDLPSATPLAGLIPAGYAPPAAMLTPRLSLVFAARGPAQALAASAVARLGQFTFTTSPIIDLVHGTASGALTAQHPEAILVARLFGVDQALVFPGAGSASLRAKFSASASAYGLDDFVMNFGALNATGRVMVENGAVTGRIDAGSIAIPPIPAGVQFPTTLPLQGKLALSAQSIIYNGQPLLGPAAASLSWSANGATLDVAHASYGAGGFSGSLGMALAAAKAPAFTGKFLLQGIDAGSLALPVAFPYPITAGTLDGNATLTASGYGLKSVMATLGGTATLNAANGRLSGFNLAAFANTLGTPDAVHGLYKALVSGSTGFSSLKLAATLANGNCTLTSATLTSPAGQVSATGGIDLYDNAQALKLTLTPAQVDPPVSATMLVLGTWTKPKHIAHMKDALAWHPSPPAGTASGK